MSEKTGPITNSVRNSAMPVITWFGGDCCRPRALRTSDSTTTILVNDVHSSSTDGATESTVIARIRVIELLGLPPPTEMSTPTSDAGAAGSTGAGGAGGEVGAAGAGAATSGTPTTAASVSSRTSASRRRVISGRRDAV